MKSFLSNLFCKLMKKVIFLLLILFCSASVFSQNELPKSRDAQRSWNIAKMYIEENSDELAVAELEKLLSLEDFAPAYLKLVELCYKVGDAKHTEIAEQYVVNFRSKWPNRKDEINDIVAMGEAREKLREKKFYDALIGDWHPKNNKMGTSRFCLKFRKNDQGSIYAMAPNQMYDYEEVTGWKDCKLDQRSGMKGFFINDLDYNSDGYNIQANMSGGTRYSEYVYLFIPFDQPEISNGKLKADIYSIMYGPNNLKYEYNWGETELIKD